MAVAEIPAHREEWKDQLKILMKSRHDTFLLPKEVNIMFMTVELPRLHAAAYQLKFSRYLEY